MFFCFFKIAFSSFWIQRDMMKIIIVDFFVFVFVFFFLLIVSRTFLFVGCLVLVRCMLESFLRCLGDNYRWLPAFPEPRRGAGWGSQQSMCIHAIDHPVWGSKPLPFAVCSLLCSWPRNPLLLFLDTKFTFCGWDGEWKPPQGQVYQKGFRSLTAF